MNGVLSRLPPTLTPGGRLERPESITPAVLEIHVSGCRPKRIHTLGGHEFDGRAQSINQYSFNKSMAERKLINNKEKRHAKYMLYQKCQYNEMFR